ncbi:hypothetical protein [Thermus thermophilus]|uniref:hypothetical protein n=1 Tax=Thermus thermophilus TaxID=274 RepID=UPI001CC81581|nr:hypothetical protein [Thermus thermophilus]
MLQRVSGKSRSATAEVEKRLQELKEKLDQDKNGIPDKLKELSEKAAQAAEAAKVKVEEASRLLKERLGKRDSQA